MSSLIDVAWRWVAAPRAAGIAAWPLMVPLLMAGIAATWRGSVRFEGATDSLGRSLKLPAAVQGGLLAAIGSSAPELFSAVFATFIHGEFELGVGSIVGSAIFNILVIPALATLMAGPQATNRAMLYRDANFYLISVAVLLLTFALAVIYFPGPRTSGADSGAMIGTINRALAALPLLTYGVYLFLQWQDMRDARPSASKSGSQPGAWGDFALGLALVVAGVEAMLRGVIWLGSVTGSPPFIWGLVIVAAATSVPDAVVSVRAMAKVQRNRDEARGSEVSISNVLGSNIFDLLVAAPAGILVAGATAVDFGIAAPLMAALTLATLAFMVAVRTDAMLGRSAAWRMLSLYAAFVVWIGLESTGTTHVLGLGASQG